MLHRLRCRLTYANVMSTLALFFALAGGSAVALSGSNTVFNDDIVNDEVTTLDVRDDNLGFGGLYSQDLGPGSVRSSEVLDDSLISADIKNSSLTGGDLVDLTVRGNDIGFNTITGENVLDGSLEDEDLGVAFVNFTARINAVPAHDCRVDPIDGVGAQGDHMLLTPNATTGGGRIVYSITYSDSAENAWLTSCNIWSSPITPGDVRFNLLVIDAS